MWWLSLELPGAKELTGSEVDRHQRRITSTRATGPKMALLAASTRPVSACPKETLVPRANRLGVSVGPACIASPAPRTCRTRAMGDRFLRLLSHADNNGAQVHRFATVWTAGSHTYRYRVPLRPPSQEHQ